jgi:hypothetical protein
MNAHRLPGRFGRGPILIARWGVIALAIAALLPGARPAAALEEEPELETILNHLGDRAEAYDLVALRFVAIESARSSEKPDKVKRYDYMYVEAEEQRYRPYRQKHTGRPGRTSPEADLEVGFPDSFSWTLMFHTDRQHLFHFEYVGQEWYSLRRAYILEFSASLPFTNGGTIYQWSGRVWVDAENSNFLKVEAEPGNQTERLREQLSAYRQRTRFLAFPLGKRPTGSKYSITFLNEHNKLSFPDQAEYYSFTLDLEGREELKERQVLRYTGYRFFDVGVLEEYLN